MYHGILNVYKEKDYTSFDVIARLRGICGQKKIGHTGTLDPQATGVLPVCFGKATKVCDMLTDSDKEYEAVLLLGKTSDTQDVFGEILSECSTEGLDEEQVLSVIRSFVGEGLQIPPMYSALKVNGKKLYELARAGITVERQARKIKVYSIDVIDLQLPRVKMRIRCSKGTYIRTICHDIGEKLGCGGLMESLVRTQAAGFRIEEAYTLAQIETIRDESGIESILKPIDSVFQDYESRSVKPEFDLSLINGAKLDVTAFCEDTENRLFTEAFRVYTSDHRFAAIYQWDGAVYRPLKMFYIESDETK